MRFRRRTHGAVSTDGLLARLRAAPPHPDLAGLDTLEMMRDTPSGITLRARSSGGPWSVALKLYGRDGAGRATRCLDQHRRAHALLQGKTPPSPSPSRSLRSTTRRATPCATSAAAPAR